MNNQSSHGQMLNISSQVKCKLKPHALKQLKLKRQDVGNGNCLRLVGVDVRTAVLESSLAVSDKVNRPPPKPQPSPSSSIPDTFPENRGLGHSSARQGCPTGNGPNTRPARTDGQTRASARAARSQWKRMTC